MIQVTAVGGLKLSLKSFFVRQIFSVVRVRAPGICLIFLAVVLTRLDAGCFQTRQVLVILLCPPKWSALPPESTQARFVYLTLPFCSA